MDPNLPIDRQDIADIDIHDEEEDNEILQQARFLESMQPNLPMFVKFENLQQITKCSREEAEAAFKIIWQE